VFSALCARKSDVLKNNFQFHAFYRDADAWHDDARNLLCGGNIGDFSNAMKNVDASQNNSSQSNAIATSRDGLTADRATHIRSLRTQDQTLTDTADGKECVHSFFCS
jgi:hypothetical protein